MGGYLSRPAAVTPVHDVGRQSKLYSAQDELVQQLMDLNTDDTDGTGITYRGDSQIGDETDRQESVVLVEEKVAALHIRPEEYEYPFENLVFEGGGVKGVSYCGAIRVLEEVGVIPRVRRLAGASAGALAASLLAVGCTAREIEEALRPNMKTMLLNNSYFWFIPNLLRLFGWSSFDPFINLIGTVFEQKTGNKDITFAELYQRFGKELCIVVTNVNLMHSEYFHPKTTPDTPIRMALRMSMTIPGLFQPVKHQSYGHDNIYVDGGVLCNYPIHCFDGWWLTMKIEDRFLARMQPLQQFPHKFHDKERFGTFNSKTLGLKVYSEYEDEVDRILLEEATPMMDSHVIPDTALSRKTMKETKIREKALEHHFHNSNAVNAFIKVLGKYNATEQVYISKEELQQALSDVSYILGPRGHAITSSYLSLPRI